MSFLEDIKVSSNKTLKKVETRVQYQDGRVFTETKSESGDYLTSEIQSQQGQFFVVDLKPDLQIGVILPGLILGSQDVAQDEVLLKQHKVTHILNCCGVTLPPMEQLHPIIKTIAILDLPETTIDSYFTDCFEFIDQALSKGCVLVHCNAGVSRSATIAIAYLMNRLNLHFKEAFAKVKSVRSSICPNPGFIEQLQQYDKKLFQ